MISNKKITFFFNIALVTLFSFVSIYLSLFQYIHPDDILAFDMYQKIKFNGDLDFNSYRKVYGGTYPPMSCLITWMIIKFNLIPIEYISFESSILFDLFADFMPFSLDDADRIVLLFASSIICADIFFKLRDTLNR